MLNILLISKDKVGVQHHFLGKLFKPDATASKVLAVE